MKFSTDNLRKRERFLSRDMLARVSDSAEGTDPFTTGDTDFPKAFRAGECRVISPDHTEIDVLFFWKDDTRSEQRKIEVETVKKGDIWLVDKVTRPSQ